MKIIDRFNAGVDFDGLYSQDVALRFCVLTALKDSRGHDYRITRTDLIRKVQLVWFWRISKTDKPPGDRKIRNCIRELRKEGAWIMSTGGTKGGYWIANSFEEVKIFVQKEFRARALDQLHTGKRVLDSASRGFGGQAHIWKEANSISRQYQEAITLLED